MSSRRLILAGFMVLALTATAGCGTSARSGQAVVSASAPMSADADSLTSASSGEASGTNESPQLSANHRVLALAAAHQDAIEIAVGRNDQPVSGWPIGINSVTAVLRSGTVSDSNTGHNCESGDIISVQLVGAFDTVTTGTTSSPDTTVREIDLSVDATTGLTCLISVRTEPVAPGPGAVVLYSR